MLWIAPASIAAAEPEARRYVGTRPCADCAALLVELALLPGGRYEERNTYVDRGGRDVTVEERGTWSRIGARESGGEGGFRLRPEGDAPPRTLRAQGRALRMADAQGADLPSPRPQRLWRSEREHAGAEIRATPADASRPLRLAAGQRLSVRLPSNPSTGYRWAIVPEAEPVVSLAATPVYERGAATGLGAAGEETWRFIASRPGRGILRLRHSQAFDPGGEARELEFILEVR